MTEIVGNCIVNYVDPLYNRFQVQSSMFVLKECVVNN